MFYFFHFRKNIRYFDNIWTTKLQLSQFFISEKWSCYRGILWDETSVHSPHQGSRVRGQKVKSEKV